jgi:hypothetical protein
MVDEPDARRRRREMVDRRQPLRRLNHTPVVDESQLSMHPHPDADVVVDIFVVTNVW